MFEEACPHVQAVIEWVNLIVTYRKTGFHRLLLLRRRKLINDEMLWNIANKKY